MNIIYFAICFCAATIGSITGVGGGIIIKPLLDVFGTMDVTTIRFLSGCTVLAMACMTLFRNRNSEIKIEKNTGTFLAIGAGVGGLIGSKIFGLIIELTSKNSAGATQAFLLSFIIFITLIFTLKKSKFKTMNIENKSISFGIGICLGTISSLLGIGGGPINLAVLYLFYSMGTKKAAFNSIYIIFFSQTASVLLTVFSGEIPVFEWSTFIVMVTGGLLGGVVGPMISKKISVKLLDKMYIALICIIILMSLYNGVGYLNKI